MFAKQSTPKNTKSKGKVDRVASPLVDAVKGFARVFVDPEVLVAIVCGAGAGVHLEVLRAAEHRPVHSDRSTRKNNFLNSVSEEHQTGSLADLLT